MNEAQPQGYCALPAGGTGPGVLVLHAWWGLNETIKSLCRRLAAEGFVAFAPDLYHGAVADTIPGAEKLADQLDYQQARAQSGVAATFLAQACNQSGRGPARFGERHLIGRNGPPRFGGRRLIGKNVPPRFGERHLIGRNVPPRFGGRRLNGRNVPPRFGECHLIGRNEPARFGEHHLPQVSIMAGCGSRSRCALPIPLRNFLTYRHPVGIDNVTHVKEIASGFAAADLAGTDVRVPTSRPLDAVADHQHHRLSTDGSL